MGGVLLAACLQLQHEAGTAESGIDQGHHRMHFGHHIGAGAAHIKAGIVGQAQHPQVLDQP
ncbi:hypothetical protein D3C86_1825270 [compost metagenome]